MINTGYQKSVVHFANTIMAGMNYNRRKAELEGVIAEAEANALEALKSQNMARLRACFDVYGEAKGKLEKLIGKEI